MRKMLLTSPPCVPHQHIAEASSLALLQQRYLAQGIYEN